MYQNHLQRSLKDHEKNHVSLVTKRNNSLLIFANFPCISLLIINSRCTHCFEHVHPGLFIGSLLSGLKHMDLVNGV